MHWRNSGSRIWAENLVQYVTVRDVCHKIELETNNLILICRHSTILKHHAWLWMLCAISMVTRIFVGWPYSYVQNCVLRYHDKLHTNPKKVALLEKFFVQFGTQILENQEKHSLFIMSAVTNSRGSANKSLDHVRIWAITQLPLL